MKLRFFKIAQACSRKSASYPKVGCVIVKKNKVVGLGFNDRRKTHPRAKNISQTLHAELHAIIGVPAEDLAGSHVYVFREYADGSLAMTKPCDACHAALIAAGVKKVFYTVTNGYTSENVE